jgi:hypothetical protein
MNSFSRFATSGGLAINVDALVDSDRLPPDKAYVPLKRLGKALHISTSTFTAV